MSYHAATTLLLYDYTVILLLCYHPVIMLSSCCCAVVLPSCCSLWSYHTFHCSPATLSYCHVIILSSYHSIILLYRYTVMPSCCHAVIQLCYYAVTPSHYCTVKALPTISQKYRGENIANHSYPKMIQTKRLKYRQNPLERHPKVCRL